MKTVKSSVLVLCKTLRKGGAEKQAMIAAKLLSRQDIPVTIIIWNGNEMDTANLKYLEDQHIICIGLHGSLCKKLVDYRKYIIQHGITLIFSYLTLANSLSALVRLCRKEIITVGGIRSEKLPFIKFLVERYVHNRINDCTVFNSFAAKEGFVRRGFKTGKAFVIHNAVMTQPHAELFHNTNEIKLISVSRFVKSKDFSTALESFRFLVDKYPEQKIRFLIVGYGKCERYIRGLIREHGLGTRVDLLLDPPNIKELLTSSDIYLSTSLVEGLSNSIMEAMAAGLPVVATDVGDNRHLIEDSKNGYIVPCRKPEVIARKLEQLILSDEIRKKFGEYSHYKICAEFTEEQMLGKYMELIEVLTSESGKFNDIF